ncbi:MAG: hypothetical protein LBG17_06430 [Bacteroidales bacterium]|jgi:fibronectin type 3 domain-containing protein|nr:hypothetical protein [Bacteroidales bacterium]
MNRKILYFLLLLSGTVFSQSNTSIRLLTRPAERDSIMLRWAPADKQTWDLGNNYGYIIQRYTLLRNDSSLNNKEHRFLSDGPVKPQPLHIWAQYQDVNKYVNIAAECIFGKSEISAFSPVAIANKYKEEQTRFSFALYAADNSLTVAKLSGLYFVDKTVQHNEKYLYTVHIAAPDSIKSDTAFDFTGISEYRPLPKPFDLKAKWGDKSVLLSWNIKHLNHIYNSYIIEKSTNGKHYELISENASVQAADEGITPEWGYRSDSLPDNKTKFYYRIRGINAFGEISAASDSVVGQGYLPVSIAPVIKSKEVIENNKVKLTWDFPEEMNKYINGFRVYRSTKPQGTKQKIYETKKTTERSFVDKNPELTNYYILSVYNNETEKLSTGLIYAELIDSVPPLAPTGLAGNVDSLGLVRISWKANTEKDIYGYRIYRSNRPDFEFLLAYPSEILDTNFMDTVNIKTLTKEIYYRLKAVDLRGNNSVFSSILELKRPDVIAPVSPVIREITADKKGISITWYNSTSSDVISHHIFRKGETDTAFEKIEDIDVSPTREKTSSYIDKNVNSGEHYLYQISAQDESGLYSTPSAPLPGMAQGNKALEQIILKARSIENDEKRDIVLTWTITAEKKIERILIYKSDNNTQMHLLGSSTENSYTDRNIKFDDNVKYRIRAVFDNGTMSDFSKEIKARQ